MANRYRTGEPCSYGELERLAGIPDRAAFWRGKREPEGRAEIHARIQDRIQSKAFCPCWTLPTVKIGSKRFYLTAHPDYEARRPRRP